MGKNARTKRADVLSIFFNQCQTFLYGVAPWNVTCGRMACKGQGPTSKKLRGAMFWPPRIHRGLCILTEDQTSIGAEFAWLDRKKKRKKGPSSLEEASFPENGRLPLDEN